MQNRFIPCPFCGSLDIKLTNCAGIRFEVNCRDCSCNIASGFISGRSNDEAEQEAVDKWNTRSQGRAMVHYDEDGTVLEVEPIEHHTPLTEAEVLKAFKVPEQPVQDTLLPSVKRGDYD